MPELLAQLLAQDEISSPPNPTGEWVMGRYVIEDLLTDDGGVFLTDFGLVRLLGQAGVTQVGVVVGTPPYMAPEQILGRSQEMDYRVDIYALGCVVYEILTGCLPFDPSDPLAPLDEDPPSPSRIVPELPEAASQVILKALAKEPGGASL